MIAARSIRFRVADREICAGSNLPVLQDILGVYADLYPDGSAQSGQSATEQRLILQSMKEIPDALLAWRAENRINSLKATLDQ